MNKECIYYWMAYQKGLYRVFSIAIRVLMVAMLLISPLSLAASDKNFRMSELEFKDANLMDAIRIISELSGNNIVATPDASKTHVTVFLRDITVHEAIEMICRVNNLWYRRDPKTKAYRIMTNEEYSEDLVIHRNDKSQIFTLRSPNIDLVADAIENLYGSRVKKTSSGRKSDVNNNSSGNSFDSSSNESNNSNNSNDNNNDSVNGSDSSSSRDVGNQLDGSLSIDQLAALKLRGGGMNLVSGKQLQKITTQQEPIYVTVVAEHNLVIVRTGDEEALTSIASLIDDLDRPIPQVMLEMKVMDVLIGDDFKSVFNFGITGSSLSGDSESPILLGNNNLVNGGFVFEFLNDRIQANIEFLEEEKRVNVISTPMILAANNRPAKLFVGEEVVIVKGYKNSEIEANGSDITVTNNNVVPETNIEEVGNTIVITPFINADKTITLNLKQESSTVKKNAANIALVSGGNVLNLPLDTINTARVEGVVIAKDGLTIAVGGLIRKSLSRQESKVPWFSDIPVLGRLFTSVQDIDQRSELILMITPRVMTQPGMEDNHISYGNLSEMTGDYVHEKSTAVGIRCLELCQ